MQHLAYKIRRSKNVRDGKQWHYNSAKKLQAKLPYLSPSTISAQVKSLQVKTLLEIGNYNKWKRDKTQWYHITPQIQVTVWDDPIKFDAEVAKEVGILPAVLHFNLYYHIRLQCRKKIESPKHMMSPQDLAIKWLPYSEPAIKLRRPRSTYTLPDADLVLMRRK
jgi:hypothetical protein